MSTCVGSDVGFSSVKTVTVTNRHLMPSVVGTPQPHKTFSALSNGDLIISINDGRMRPLGETALIQSTHTTGRRDASWVMSEMWLYLFVGGLISVLEPKRDFHKLRVVTGLPVSDWAAYHEKLKRKLKHVEFTVSQQGRSDKEIFIDEISVCTQPYGTFAGKILRLDGTLVNNQYAHGQTGIIDIGGNTINFLTIVESQEVPRYTESSEFGLLHTLESVRDDIRSTYPRLMPSTHEVSEWIAQGYFRAFGEEVDVMPFAQPHLEPLVDVVMDKIDNTWPQAARFDNVVLTGGGSAAIGNFLGERLGFANVEIESDSRWANANGYLKLAKRFERG